jgi:hypothetical protein
MYEIELVVGSKPKRYRVKNTETGKYYSKKGMMRKKALSQKAILEQAGDVRRGGALSIEQAVGQSDNTQGIDVSGAGFFQNLEKVKNVVTKLVKGDNSYPNRVRDFLYNFGNYRIKSAMVVRQPVESWITKALNFLSFGQFSKALSKTPYDKLFHLSLDVTIENPDTNEEKTVKIEKNERITFAENKANNNPQSAEMIPIELPDITLNEFMENGKNEMGQNFFSYSASNNCQDFLLGLLRGNHSAQEDVVKFIKQDVSEVFNQNPFLRNIVNKVTKLGGISSIVQQGGTLQDGVEDGVEDDPNKPIWNENLTRIRHKLPLIEDLPAPPHHLRDMVYYPKVY